MGRELILIGGSSAQKVRHGGSAWVLLQYILGFQRLGWDVLFIDRLEPEMCEDASGQPCPLEASENLRAFERTMGVFGLKESCCLIHNGGQAPVGITRKEAIARARESTFLLNVMGFVQDEEILGAVPRRVFLDIDPGFPHMWRELGLADVFTGHDDFVTIGERVGFPECSMPTCGLEWVTTRQPIVLEHWPRAQSLSRRFTSVGSWRGAYGPIDYQGRTYGLRVHEFRRFAELPRRSGQSFEVALDIDPRETKDLALLDDNGWSLVDPKEVAGDPWAYREYVQASGAEFGVAKNMYVETRSGWFSDRSVCYLASGKPVVVQDTGLADLYPIGKGLLTFSTLEEAFEAVEEVSENYDSHSRAARSIAEEYFDSDIVLGELLRKLGVA